ncbi:MAG: hypothetical protein DI611_07730 [Brachybacterium faecium]|nr:MAG: hypothetical protein DI611_07730 [Brachybacterium faecium]
MAKPKAVPAGLGVKYRNMKTYLLGAGFSKALHPKMPLMVELGKTVATSSGTIDEIYLKLSENIEEWLSYLAGDQPWLDESSNLENRAKFSRVSTAIAENITANEPTVSELSKTSSLDQLLRLVHKWCNERSAIISLNYDCIIESALGIELGQVRERDLYVISLESRRDYTGMFTIPPTTDLRPRLHKLHGSTNWLYHGIENRFSPIVLRENIDYPSAYAGLHPVIIPPTSFKSAFYSNSSLRAQWESAGSALQRTSELTIIGYSLPASDLQIHALLKTQLSQDASLTIVDRSSDSAERIADELKVNNPRIFTGDTCLSDYLDSITPPLWRYIPAISNSPCEHLGFGRNYVTRRASYDTSGYELSADTLQAVLSDYLNIAEEVEYHAEPDRSFRVYNSGGNRAGRDADHPWSVADNKMELTRDFPESFASVEEGILRRSIRILGDAWAQGWTPNKRDVDDLISYLQNGYASESTVERFGIIRDSNVPPRWQLDYLDRGLSESLAQYYKDMQGPDAIDNSPSKAI